MAGERGPAPHAGRLTFGLGLFTGQNPEGPDPLYWQAPELAVAAEEVGFDVFWLSEHHGMSDGYLPSPLPLAGAVLARTSTLRVGTGLAIAPLYHPMRLAEDAAVLDRFSDGRLILGLGIGYAQHEYDAYGVDASRRGTDLAATIALLRQAWSGSSVEVQTDRGETAAIRVRPLPVTGDIPLWLGGYADAALRRAARVAQGHLIGRGDPQIVQAADAILGEHRSPHDPHFTVAVNLLVDLQGEPGDRVTQSDSLAFRRGFLHQQQAYERIQRGQDVFGGHVRTPEEDLRLEELDSYLHAHGTSEQIVDQVERALEPLARWANLHVVIRALAPQRDLAGQVRRVETLGTQVLPALRARLRRS